MLRNFSKKSPQIKTPKQRKRSLQNQLEYLKIDWSQSGKFAATKSAQIGLLNGMNKDLEAKNLVQFRLTGTPDGNLLVSFYQLDTFSQEAVNWHIAGLLVENRMNAQVLYEGNLQNNTHYQPAVYKLLERVTVYVNCVRIERVK